MESRFSVLHDSDSRFRIDEKTNFNKVCAHFSLARIESGRFCFRKLERNEKAQFVDSLFKRRQMTWDDINKLEREKLGFENLPRKKFKPNTPSFVTEDTREFMVFRFGSDGRMAGYRIKYVFYILWVDCKYKLYKH